VAKDKAPTLQGDTLGAVEITQVCVRVPAWPTGTLIDVHALKIYVHLHLPPDLWAEVWLESIEGGRKSDKPARTEPALLAFQEGRR